MVYDDFDMAEVNSVLKFLQEWLIVLQQSLSRGKDFADFLRFFLVLRKKFDDISLFHMYYRVLNMHLASEKIRWVPPNGSESSEHLYGPFHQEPLVACLLLVAMPGAPSSFLFLVVRPGAPSSVSFHLHERLVNVQ